jgi:hypothetical protein
MSWAQTDYLIVGIIIGYILNPFLAATRAILVNAWKNTGSACNQNCNQGRNCNCETK